MSLPIFPTESKAKPVSHGEKAISFQWHFTDLCNWRCTHCYHEAYQDQGVDLERMKSIFHEFLEYAEKNNIPPEGRRVKLTGGDPFVRPDFMEFLAYLSSYRETCVLSILTNGSLLTEEKAQFLKKHHPTLRIQISVEGPEDLNDAVRGKGAFQKILDALSLLKKHDIFTTLACVITKQNYERIEELLDLAMIYDTPLLLRRLVPIGQSDGKDDNMVPTQELRKLYKGVRQLNKQYFLRTPRGRMTILRTNCLSGIEAADNHDDHIISCGARRKTIFCLMPNLDILPCRLLPQFTLGNLEKQSLASILDGEMYQTLSSSEKGDPRCQSCDALSHCQGGAMCIAMAAEGSPFARDPQCWK